MGGWGVPTITYTGRFFPTGYIFQFRTDYSTFFSFVSFCYREVKQLAPLKRKALRLVKLPSFESDLLKSDEDIGPQSRAKFYRSRPFVWLVPDTKFIDIELHSVLLNVVYS